MNNPINHSPIKKLNGKDIKKMSGNEIYAFGKTLYELNIEKLNIRKLEIPPFKSKLTKTMISSPLHACIHFKHVLSNIIDKSSINNIESNALLFMKYGSQIQQIEKILNTDLK